MSQRDRKGKRVQNRIPLFRDVNERVCVFYETGRQCPRGAKCPFRHEMHKNPYRDDPVTVELLAKAGDMPLIPPTDQSIKTLYIRRLNSSVLEQDIRDHFCPYGEIESIRFFDYRGGTCAFLTYTTRQAAEKAILELSSWTDINGQRLKLLWGPDQDTCNRCLSHKELPGSSSTDNHGASSS